MNANTTSRGAQVTLNGEAFSALIEGAIISCAGYMLCPTAPSCLVATAQVADSALASLSEANQWGLPSTALPAWPVCCSSTRAKVHAWLAIEAGYGWTTPMVLALTTQTTSRNRSTVESPTLVA